MKGASFVIYWDGNINRIVGSIPRYEGGRNMLMNLPYGSSFQDLVNLVYNCTKINPEMYDLILKTNCPIQLGIWDVVEINGDSSLIMMMTTITGNYKQLFVETRLKYNPYQSNAPF